MRQPRTIAVHCRRCRALLYRYRKWGTGGLVKCHPDRIIEDHTNGDLCCPGCQQQFARPRAVAGKTIYRIIRGKVYTRGMTRH